MLIATGSVDFTIAELDDPHAALLRKPYTMLELRSIARRLLGTPLRIAQQRNLWIGIAAQ